ncbi:hypothetical protein L484_026811 [Morus notabilis]|uniref:Morc S5 domain-containing protein n=1 Tax=Morus notabilis TaxID=981085 RepID=W9SDD0_9ROSA|nr:hypothetical protein L484_026811 [Morus notabilis]
MPPKPVKEPPAAVVALSDSDGEDADTGVSIGNSEASSDKAASGTGGPLMGQPELQSSAATTPVSDHQQHQSFESRSFWKAGDYAVDPSARPTLLPHEQLEHARVHPKFLHSNATSHKWAFGAIAELLDNAIDEIHNGATFVKVDKIDVMKDSSPALLFQDDGGGMDPQGIRKCMSLGYSTKKTNTTIGQYGNGFKTSTMRLGADVIVFTRANCKGQATQSVGLLSYTYLRKTGLDDVIVPMIDFDISSHWAEPIIYGSHDDWSSDLKTILEWSPFTSKEELMLQFDDIGAHGTKVIIYNLWLNDEGIYELSFDDDDEDIRLRDEANCASSSTKFSRKQVELQSHISYRIRYSLRAYASMLYLKKFKNFSIILRGKPVEQYNIADELQHAVIVKYKPQLATTSKEITVETKLGFIKEAPAILGVNGFNVYLKNRLIKPFWKVIADGSSKGSGVVGVLEANFLEPAHDKQDFERSPLSIRLETKLKQMVTEYWNKHCHFMGYQTPGTKKQKNDPVQSPVQIAANTRKQLSANQHNAGVSGAVPGHTHLNQSNSEPCRSGKRPDFHRDFSAGSYEAVSLVVPIDDEEPLSVDQICKENIQLHVRCDAYVIKQSELKQTVGFSMKVYCRVAYQDVCLHHELLDLGYSL